jgi:hypothetical protein
MRNHTMGNDTFWKQLKQRAQQFKVNKHEIFGNGCFGLLEFLDFETYENNELDCFCLALIFYFLWWALMLGIRIYVTCYT